MIRLFRALQDFWTSLEPEKHPCCFLRQCLREQVHPGSSRTYHHCEGRHALWGAVKQNRTCAERFELRTAQARGFGHVGSGSGLICSGRLTTSDAVTATTSTTSASADTTVRPAIAILLTNTSLTITVAIACRPWVSRRVLCSCSSSCG